MLRHSARLKEKARPETAELDIDSELDDNDEEFQAKSTKKRRKTTTNGAEANNQTVKRPRGNRGKLQQLTEFPLDVLFEIFGHLCPSDVLHLARTTKALRGILMRRSAISVWKQARANDDIPDCPSDLTEPQYANLAFDPRCHFCLAPHVPTVFWACRTRCCKRCIPENFVDGYTLQARYNFSVYWSDILPYATQLDRRGRRGSHLYNNHQAEIMFQEYTQVKDDTVGLHQWMEEKKKAFEERKSHASQCEIWQQTRGLIRSQENFEIRRRRKDAIFRKLKELGWGEDVDLLNHYNKGGLPTHALVKKGQELTERIWNNIKPALVEYLQDARVKRLKSARREGVVILSQLLAEYGASHPFEIIPSTADIAYVDAFRSIIEGTSAISRQSFSEAMADLPRCTAEWRRSKDQELATLMNKDNILNHGMENGDSLAGLELATTFFKCYTCSEPISYPRILKHNHLSHFRHDYEMEGELGEFLSAQYIQPWNFGGDRVTFYDAAYHAARSVVQANELNPNITSARNMDEADHMVECLHCRDSNGTRLAMTWRWAVYHAITVHPEETAYSWQLVSPEDVPLGSRVNQSDYVGIHDTHIEHKPWYVRLPAITISQDSS